MAGEIAPRFLQELRDRLTLSDIIGSRVKVVRAGREYKACCPFHKEKTPSFTINNEKGFYHCFGCGAHGDAVSFRMQHDNMSFIEAVEDLAAAAGMTVPQATPEQKKEYDRQKVYYDILEAACKWFEAQVDTGDGRVARDYLRSRSLSDEAVSRFRIGYAPNSWDAFRDAMVSRGFALNDLVTLGLLKKGTQADKPPYAFFRGRLMFPVMDRRGRVIAFGGRHLAEAFDPIEIRGKEPAKYMNSPDHPLFHKGRNLYGLSRARQVGAAGEPIILCEGYTDVIALVLAGYAGAVAPLGTAVTEEQIVELWRLCPNEGQQPFLCFDGDKAGRMAAYRVIDRAMKYLKPGKSLSFVFMPEGEDPDSLVRTKGRDAFRPYLENAQALVDVIWEKEVSQTSLDTPELRAGLEARLMAVADEIADRTVQNHYRRLFKDRIFQLFRQKGGASGYNKNKNADSTQVSAPVPRLAGNAQALQAKILMAALINHPEFIADFSEKLGSLVIPFEALDSIRQILLVESDVISPLTTQNVKQHLSEQGFDTTLLELDDESVLAHAAFAREEADDEQAGIGIEELLNRMARKKKAVL